MHSETFAIIAVSKCILFSQPCNSQILSDKIRELLAGVVAFDCLGLYHAGRVTALHVLTVSRDRPRHIARSQCQRQCQYYLSHSADELADGEPYIVDEQAMASNRQLGKCDDLIGVSRVGDEVVVGCFALGKVTGLTVAFGAWHD